MRVLTFQTRAGRRERTPPPWTEAAWRRPTTLLYGKEGFTYYFVFIPGVNVHK